MTPSRPRLRERLLGAFVLFELFLIPFANYIKLVPARIPEDRGELNGELQTRLDPKINKIVEPIQTIKDWTAFAVSRWGEATGQLQCWALFAAFGKQAAMPTVELVWPTSTGKEPAIIPCTLEPADPANYFYWPHGGVRLFHYEYRMVIFHWTFSHDPYEGKPDEHRKAALSKVRDMQRSIGAFLRWRVSKYLAEHPGTPMPECVILKAHILPDPPPGASVRDRPTDYYVPVARWYPALELKSDELSIEGWDPIHHDYVRFRTSEEP